jgi:cytochrome c oxidase subunit 4
MSEKDDEKEKSSAEEESEEEESEKESESASEKAADEVAPPSSKKAAAKKDDHDHDHDHGHDHGDHGDLPYGADEVHAHIGSYKGYLAVFMALIFFTLLTVGVASIHLGKANLAVAVVIASIKAALVCTFFMHLKDDNKFNSLILISAVTFIGVFFALTINDVAYREKLDPQSGNRMFLQSGDKAPGSWENPIKKEEGPGAENKPEAKPAPTTTATASAQPVRDTNEKTGAPAGSAPAK